jgi:hypothetical protein
MRWYYQRSSPGGSLHLRMEGVTAMLISGVWTKHETLEALGLNGLRTCSKYQAKLQYFHLSASGCLA